MIAIKTKKLTKKFKDKVAVNEIDLNIKRGEIFTDINWKRDSVYGYYGVDLYVPEVSLEAGQAYIKEIFDNIVED